MAFLKGVDSREVGETPLGVRDPSFPHPGLTQVEREGGLDPGKKALALGGQGKGGAVDTKMEKDE